MSLSHNDVVKLLALVAAIDDVTVTETKIEAWKAMAEQGEWESFAIARRALLVYRSEQPDFPIKPGHITKTIERARAMSMRDYVPPPLPRDLRDDPRAEIEWAAKQRREYRLGFMDSWARGDNNLAALERGGRSTKAWT